MKYIDVYVTIWVFIYNTFFVIYSHLYGNMHVQYTVMVKNIGTPALPLPSQKIVAITNALVFTCLFILFALEKHKKSEGKKANSHKKYIQSDLCSNHNGEVQKTLFPTCSSMHIFLKVQFFRHCLVTTACRKVYEQAGQGLCRMAPQRQSSP